MGITNNRIWNMLLRTLLWGAMLTFVGYGVPAIKHAIFPTFMTKIEKMLSKAEFEDCKVHIDRIRETMILLTISVKGKPPVTTEIYKDVIVELNPENSKRVFFTHSINKNSDGSRYLTETKFWANENLTHLYRLEAKRCDLLESKDGIVPYEKHVPIYHCAVPEMEVSCIAVKDIN